MLRDVRYTKESQPMRPINENTIYGTWLCLTNGGYESPEFHFDKNKNAYVLTVADNQVFCEIPYHDNAEVIADGLCAAGDVISRLKNQIFTMQKRIDDLQKLSY